VTKMNHMNLDFFRSKRVLITGHTGFKGSWLSEILTYAGAEVYGISLELSDENNHYKLGIAQHSATSQYFDIVDFPRVKKIIKDFKPDFIFHLAAQALVRTSYEQPELTWRSNVLGTQSVLEALRGIERECIAVFITSDKCYANKEWCWGYRETDELGGVDPYSSSKAAAELLISSYHKSYFSQKDSPVKLASARAGNVIGGGDWSKDRIVPDCIKRWARGEKCILRSPSATRPWQHVLEPLNGYLTLARAMSFSDHLSGEAFNFGPNETQVRTVYELVESMSARVASKMPSVEFEIDDKLENKHEAGLLKLNCDKAFQKLKWLPKLNFENTVEFTADWYSSHYTESYLLTIKQIQTFFAQDSNI